MTTLRSILSDSTAHLIEGLMGENGIPKELREMFTSVARLLFSDDAGSNGAACGRKEARRCGATGATKGAAAKTAA